MNSPAGGRMPASSVYPSQGSKAVVRPVWLQAVIAMLLLVLVAGAGPAAAADGRGAVLVVDANTGNTLYASAADEPRYPASLTKMMTLYMVFDLIERGRLTYQTPIRVSANAAAAAPSKLDLGEGEEISLIDAIRVLITKSANDVAIAVAEHIGGSEANFARMMTQKAHQIGMNGTTFRNASGLPDTQQVTTARDMATLALRLQDEFPQHYVLFGTRTFAYKGETFKNHNTLLFHYEGADGIKTGYTRASGFNLVSSVKRGNKHVIGVVFGGASAATRNNAMRTYLNMGLVKASPVRTRKGTPQLVARAPAPERIAAVPTPRPVQLPSSAPQPHAAVQPSTGNGLTMVRVRPVPMPEVRPAHAETAGISPPSRRVLPAAAHVQPGNVPGPAPSTLEAQAARLARGEPVASPAPLDRNAPRVAGPKAPAKPSVAHARQAAPGQARFHVQIGAFPSAQEAERQLAAVKSRAPGALGLATPLTQPVQQGDKTLYRARYAGLDSATANEACNALKTQGVSCLVFKGE